ncbi:hypothetical protein CAI21_17430 [Alkalilimnicola ehrlichii]|nr:hypothetical protein CAI21_17430 [Alkalilimnicola ehrlichii]
MRRGHCWRAAGSTRTGTPPKPAVAETEPAIDWAPLTVTLYFGFDADTLDTEAQAALTQAFATVPENALNTLSVELDGHADHLGNPGYNQQLSRRRAEAVRDWLLTQGVPTQAVTLHAHGDSHARQADTAHCPDDDLRHCLRDFRRVELRIQTGLNR